MRRIVVALVLGHFALAPPSAGAELSDLRRGDQPFEITADSMEYESQRDLYVAKGSVVLSQGDRSIRADWMTFSNQTQVGIASGSVVVTDGDQVLHTEFVEFDLTNLEGLLLDGYFASQAPQFRLEGKEIQKTGENTYTFENGLFTTCRCEQGERDPWVIEADSADIEINGYGTARNTTFEILGVPVVWLPWMIYPLKTERQSGLLLPDLGYGGRNGFEVGLPLFWAARQDLNVTVTPYWMSSRGYKGDLDVEYVFGEDSWVDAFGSFVYDTKISPHTQETPFSNKRWATVGKQVTQLPLGIEARSDVMVVSDNDYVIDFSDLRDQRSDRYLQSNTFAGRSFDASGRYGFVASTVYANDLQAPDDIDRDRYLLQRLPNVEVSALPAPLRWLDLLVPSSNVQYTYFGAFREATSQRPTAIVRGNRAWLDTGIDGIPDANERGTPPDPDRDNAIPYGGPEGDGIFQEGEPLADRGHRLRLHPQIGMPMRIADLVEFYPQVGWHEHVYQTEAQSTESWGTVTGRADLRTHLIKRFGNGVSHHLEPRIGWAITSTGAQSGEPVFIPATAVPQRRIRQLDLDLVTDDPADRVRKFNGITWGIANRIFAAARDGEAPRLLADFQLSSQYEFFQGEMTGIYFDGDFYPSPRLRSRLQAGYDPSHDHLQEVLAQLEWWAESGHRVSFGYRYLRDIPQFFEDFKNSRQRFDHYESGFNRVNQINLALRLALSQQWAATYGVAYSFQNSLLLRNAGGIEYTSRCRCWAVRLEVREDRASDVRFNLVYSLIGLGNDYSYGTSMGGVGFLDGF